MSTLLSSGLRSGVPVVNLLPPEFAEREHLRKLQVKLGAVVALALLLVIAGYLQARGGRAVAQDDLADTQAVTTQLQVESARYVKVPEARARLAAAEATLAQATALEIHWSEYLDDLASSVPKNVWIVQLSGSVNDAAGGAQAAAATQNATGGDGGVGTVTFTGAALKYEDVASWLDSLGKQRGYSNPWSSNLQSVSVDNPDGGGGSQSYVKFDSSVTLTQEALDTGSDR